MTVKTEIETVRLQVREYPGHLIVSRRKEVGTLAFSLPRMSDYL